MDIIQIALPESEKTMACYDFEYAMLILRQAIDFAEIEHDFVPRRMWVNEVEQSDHDLGAMDGRLYLLASQDVLMAFLKLDASGAIPPEEVLRQIQLLLNSGRLTVVETELKPQYQFA
jgi:hypothetical protein